MKKKIAFIPGVFFPDYGGAQIQCHNIANRLVELGFDIHMFTYKNSKITNNKYSISTFNIFILKFVFILNYYFSFNFEKILEIYLKKIFLNKNYIAWHFHFINYKSLILINVLKRLDQKIIVTFQGIDLQLKKKINYGYRLDEKYNNLLRKTLKNIDYFFYISSTIKKDLMNLGVKEHKLKYFPNSIIEKKFSTKVKKFNKFSQITFLTVGRYAIKKKGYDRLPIIAKYLIKHKINFKWIIVGSNCKKLLSNKFISQNKKFFCILDNIKNNNEIYFPSSKLIKLYNKSNFYVNLSRIESFGITYIESLASKLPIISFNIKGANEIIKNNINGIIVKKNNVIEFAKLLKKTVCNKKKLKLLRSNCCKEIKKYYLDKCLKSNLKVYLSKR